MRALQRQRIVDVFVLVDDYLPKQVKPGTRSVLTNSELLTILIWDGLTEPHKNLSDDEVSARSPLGLLLMGAKVGDSIKGKIGDRTVTLTVKSIEVAEEYFAVGEEAS